MARGTGGGRAAEGRLDPALLKLAGIVLVGAVAVQFDLTIINVAIDTRPAPDRSQAARAHAVPDRCGGNSELEQLAARHHPVLPCSKRQDCRPRCWWSLGTYGYPKSAQTGAPAALGRRLLRIQAGSRRTSGRPW
jgi:hypothetical protein